MSIRYFKVVLFKFHQFYKSTHCIINFFTILSIANWYRLFYGTVTATFKLSFENQRINPTHLVQDFDSIYKKFGNIMKKEKVSSEKTAEGLTPFPAIRKHYIWCQYVPLLETRSKILCL